MLKRYYHQNSGSPTKRKLTTLYNDDLATFIQSLPFSYTSVPDRLIWEGTSSGRCTTKSGYDQQLRSWDDHLIRLGNAHFPRRHLWKLKPPCRLVLFKWKMLQDSLPTKQCLNSHHIAVPILCVFSIRRMKLPAIYYFNVHWLELLGLEE